MRAIILEDERIAAERLKRLINEIDQEIDVVKIYDSLGELNKYLNENKGIDVLFLDIHVADGNSFELFKNNAPESKIVFVTAYDEFAVEAFRKNATDYLLKPIKKDELEEAIYKVRNSLSKQEKADGGKTDRFLIRFGSKIYIVKKEDIAYIHSENKISYFIQKDGKKVPSDLRMQDILNELDENQFFRLNRQCISHLDSITDILTYTKARLKIKLNPPLNEDIVISTETTPEFKRWLSRKN
jgi:two-component system LytT family response regulator